MARNNNTISGVPVPRPKPAPAKSVDKLSSSA